MVLVDTNVLLDVLEDDPTWADWSQRQLDAFSLRGRLCINPIIYSELSIAFARIEELEAVLKEGGLLVEPIPNAALFLAGKAFLKYRQRKGVKTNVLPDFLIGAHAAVSGLAIVTRDVGRYQSDFPTVTLVTPE